jgi:hypothetical protein
MLPVSTQARLKFVDVSTAHLCFLVFVSFVFCVSLSVVLSFIYFTRCRVNRPFQEDIYVYIQQLKDRDREEKKWNTF